MRRVIGLALLGCLLVALPASGEVLYGADGAGGNASTNLYILDPATGSVLATVGPIGFSVTGLAVHPATGVLYGSTSRADSNAPSRLITIDKSTGAGTVVGPFLIPLIPGFDVPPTLADLTFTSDGTLYGSNSLDANLYVVNLMTGQATKVGAGDPDLVAFGAGLAADTSGTIYLVTDGDGPCPSPSSNCGSLRTINRMTGVITEVGTLDGTTSQPIAALAFNGAGTLYGARLDNLGAPPTAHLVTIDTASRHVTEVGPTVDRLDAIAFDPTGTPPPPPSTPTVSLSLNQQTFHADDPFQLSVTVANQGSDVAVDILFGAVLPPSPQCPANDPPVLLFDGSFGVAISCLSALPANLQRFATSVVIPGPLSPITVPGFFSFVWPRSAPPGIYTFFMAFLAPPGVFQVIAVGIATASFTQ